MTWQTKKLGDLAMIVDGTHQTPKYVSEGIPFYSVENVTANNFSETKFVSDKVYMQESEDRKIRKNDILMTRIGDIGTAKLIDWDVKASFYVSLALIRCDYKQIAPRYLVQVINSNIFKKDLLKKSLLVAFPNKINLGDINKCTLRLPNLAEQKRIVGVLEVWDEYLEKLERKIELKEQSKLFLSYSIINQEIIKGAAQKKVKDLCLIRTGKKDVNQGNPNGAYPFFTCSRDYTYSDDFSYDCEAILIAGNADVGHCKYYAGKFEAYQRTYILSDFSKVDAKYMFYVMSLYFKREIESKKQSGAMSYIKLPMLQNFLVSVPELSVQKDIANKLDNINTEIELLKSKKSQIEQQKKFLLKKLVSGELRTPEDILEKGVSR